MALRDITKNKAYIARQSANKWVDSLLNNIVNETSNLPQGNNNATWGTVNWSWITAISAESFDRETGINTWSGVTTFQNWKVISQWTPYSKSYTSSNTIAWPTTANNLTRAQTTAQIWWRRQDLGMKNMEDIYDPLKKEEQKLPSFDYNTNLSNLYWKWLTDKSAIFWELSKDKSFASLDNIKQQEYITNMQNNIKDMNDAKAKADMTNQEFDPAEYARLKGFDIQTGDVKEIQKWRKEITDTLKYQGTIYDNNAEDMKFKKEQTIKQLDQNIEQTKIQVNRQIDDVMQQSQQTIAMWEKVGALKGYNKSGGYVQWLMNIQQEAMQNIQRLQQDLARAEMLTGEDKALAMQEYEKNMTRSKEEFDYKMRSVIADGQTELWRLVMWKYDPKKLWEMLDNLSYDVIQKRMDIEAQYINNIKGANDVVSQQFDQYRAMDDYTDKQRQEFTSILNANNGEALASMSAKDIENFVSQGMLSPEQWAAYYQSMVSKTIGALSKYGIPTQDDIDTVIDSIKNGSTPLQSVAWVVQNNSDRYSSVKDKFMTVWANSSVFNTQTWQFMTSPWTTTWVSSTYTGKPVPAVEPQTVQQGIQQITQKYTIWSKWWQCGSFVNNYLQNMWLGRMFVDPIDKKAQLSNSQIPTVWSVAIMDSPSSPQYGHVAIVTKVNPDWSFQTIESNKAWEEKVFTRTMKAWSAKYGFFDPTKWMSAGAQETQWWSNKVMDAFWMINFDKPTLQKQQQATVQNLIAKWDEEWAKLKLINLTKEWLSSAEAKKTFEASRSMVSSLWQIQETLAKLKAKWVNTWLLTGKYEEIANKFGKTWDKEVARLGTTLRDQLDALRRSRSGAALTTFEEEFYNRLFPSEGKSYNLNEQVIKWLQDSRNMLVRADIESVYWQDYANYLLSATEWRIQKNVAPAQSVLDKLTTQALAKQGKTTTPTKTTTAPVNKDKEARLRALMWI